MVRTGAPAPPGPFPGAAHDIYEAEVELNHSWWDRPIAYTSWVIGGGTRHQRTRGSLRSTYEAVCCSPSTNRLTRVGRRHSSVAGGSGKSVRWSQCRDKDYRNRLAGSGRPVVNRPLVVKVSRES